MNNVAFEKLILYPNESHQLVNIDLFEPNSGTDMDVPIKESGNSDSNPNKFNDEHEINMNCKKRKIKSKLIFLI